MRHLAHLVHAFLVGVFAPAVADLDAPQFAKRQAASATLKRRQPASWPVLLDAADRTDSPETRSRCETILANALRPQTEAEFDAVFEAIVADPWERNGIPWTRDWVGPWIARNNRAQAEFARWARLDPDGHWGRWRTVYAFDGSVSVERDWETGTETVPLNDRRFARLGLPPTSDPMSWDMVRCLWKHMKAGRR